MKFLRFVLLGLTALAVIIAGVALLKKAVVPAPHPVSATATANWRPGDPAPHIDAVRRTFENMLKSAPDYAVFFQRLNADFPSEYESFLSALAQRSAASGEVGSPDLHLAEAVRSLRLSRGILAGKAGRAALEHIFELQLAMLKALAAKDPRLCVEFLNGGESPAYFEFASQNRKLVAAVAVAGIDAIRDGEMKRVEREAPTVAEFDALEQSLREKGLGTPEIEALLDGTQSNPTVEEAKMCRAGQIYLETLATLPEESRLRIYGLAVELMARS
ncbi:MAG: hypothetical protein L0Y50_01450 [Beijerinckiaceae bacterium]|nr:hypothetical protein [Beijerinckiaceae bacterium]MCI0734938.1 hypothetical protein [Beijerinckiaceae bacterium]